MKLFSKSCTKGVSQLRMSETVASGRSHWPHCLRVDRSSCAVFNPTRSHALGACLSVSVHRWWTLDLQQHVPAITFYVLGSPSCSRFFGLFCSYSWTTCPTTPVGSSSMLTASPTGPSNRREELVLCVKQQRRTSNGASRDGAP